MTRFDALRDVLALQLNFERAQAFAGPVLVSLDSSVTVVGFSVAAIDKVDVMVEANHLVPESLDNVAPTVLTTRSWLAPDDPETEWTFHALDYLLADSLPDEKKRRGMLDTIEGAERTTRSITVDKTPITATRFQVESRCFLRYMTAMGGMVTVAAPEELLAAGFTTTI